MLLGEAACKGGHHSLPCQNILPYGRVRCGSAAGEGLAVKDAAQIRRNLLEGQVVLLVAVGATGLVEALPCRLLRGERQRDMATAQAKAQTGCQPYAKKASALHPPDHVLPTPSVQTARSHNPS